MNTTLQHGDPIADGKYIIDHELGEGGLAVVYKVRHATLDTPFAVKILKVTLPSLQDRLITEGQLQASLQHPNVVKVTDVIKVDGFPALVMEFIDGIAMDDYLNEATPSTTEAENLFLQILDAVEEAHERGIIHRDLKPANVMMQRTRTKMIPKVCDFGLGKNLAKEGQTRTGQQMGTPAYMAPEQIRSTKDVDQRADIFSLGAILYELLTGHRAFRGSNTLDLLNAVASQPHPTPRLYISDLEDRYVQAIDGALTKNAQFRIPDCATFRRVLLGEEEWRVGRPSGNMEDGSDTLMSLGLDLMGERTSQADTAMGFMDSMEPQPQLSSLVAERRVHHGPNSPNSTVVQQNPNAQSAAMPQTEVTTSSKEQSTSSSKGLLFGGIALVAAIAGFFLVQDGTEAPTVTEPTPTAQTTAIDAPTKTVPNVEEPALKEAEPENTDRKSTNDTKITKKKTTSNKDQAKKPQKDTSQKKVVKKAQPKQVTKEDKTTPKPTSPKTVEPVAQKSVPKPVEKEATTAPETQSNAKTGRIVFASAPGMESAYLLGSNGKTYTSGSTVPVGQYTIKVKCNGKAGGGQKHTVQENKTATYLCNCMMKTCSVK